MTDEQLAAWRRAIAEHRRRQRNQRGRRDPWAKAQPVTYRPAPSVAETTDGDPEGPPP